METVIKINKNHSIKKIDASDALDIFHLIDSNREHLREWLPFVDMTLSPANTSSFIEQLEKPCSRELVFIIRYKNSTVGLVGVKDIDRVNQKLEIGYWISKAAQGKGLVTESCRSLIKMAFENMDMNRIQIKCGVGNVRSSNIPKNLGFVFEGVEHDGEKHCNRFIDLEVFSLLRRDWVK